MTNNILQINNLHFSYPDGTRVLNGLTLNVLEGESIGIIGPNGAGKSTLLLHLNGILKGAGEISISGLKITEGNIKKIRALVGVVFQDPDNQLFMPTVAEDVAFGPTNIGWAKAEIEEKVQKALEEVEMNDKKDHSSHHLSFGEKKRVSLATVLSMGPKILVLDEPSSNLDPKRRRSLINLLNNLHHTKIIATHDLNLVKECCNKVAILKDGRFVAIDTTEKIINNRVLLEENELGD